VEKNAEAESESHRMSEYDDLLRKAVTAFHLPAIETVGLKHFFDIAPKDHSIEEIHRRLPFDGIHIVQPVLKYYNDEGFEFVCTVYVVVGRSAQNAVYYAAKYVLRQIDGDYRETSFDESKKIGTSGVIWRLLSLIDDRQSRYVEQRVSRPVRRAMGVNPNYREYIIVKKRSAKPGALRLSEIVRRHPQLHAVRGHLRHLKNGAVALVRPHARGKGKALQVKDYVIA
jgi:hypothetical protein